jgi:hypothetical protein
MQVPALLLEESRFFRLQGIAVGAIENAPHANENLTVHFNVKDYATWRKSYDRRANGRVSAGSTNEKIFRNPEDPNDLVILQDVADVTKARSWLASNDTKAAMQRSGVIGVPTIRFAA